MTIYTENNENIYNKNKKGFLAEVSIALSECLTQPNYILAIATSQDIKDYVEDFFEETEIDHVSERLIILNNHSSIHFLKDDNNEVPDDTNTLIVDDALIPKGSYLNLRGQLEEYALPF